MNSINDISKKIKQKKQRRIISFSIIGLSVLMGFFSIILVNSSYFGGIFVVVPFSALVFYIGGLLISFYIPDIKNIEFVRYYIYHLNISLRNKNLEESSDCIDKITTKIEKIIKGMAYYPFQEQQKRTLNKLTLFLKYNVYPYLLDKKSMEQIDVDVVEKIESAFETDDLLLLSKILEKEDFDNLDTSVILPHEMPNFIKRNFSLIQEESINLFHGVFMFRLTLVIIFLLFLGYVISNVSLLEFNTTFISALLILSIGIAKEIN